MKSISIKNRKLEKYNRELEKYDKYYQIAYNEEYNEYMLVDYKNMIIIDDDKNIDEMYRIAKEKAVIRQCIN